MKVRLSALAALVFAVACEPTKEPTAIVAPSEPSQIISDGAHGGNKDFFFLPPMVSNPASNPNFEPGQFNSTLAPRLTVEICQLLTSPVNAQGLPVVTDCVTGPPIKKFGAGTVQLQNPPDGFYQVLWNARESALNDAKFYRIKVLLEGSSTPFGVADLDPMSNMKELRNAVTGEIIPLNDNSTLPIKFRIEHGGGSTLCGTADLCVSTTVSNNNPAGFQTVTVDGGGGAIGGAKFPNGWLPAGGPQNVVVTIASVDLGSTNPGNGTSGNPCHIGLPLQQFPGCFNFTTTPALAPINENGDQFAQAVTVAVCYSLQGTGDPREKFAEMYASGPNEPPHALQDVNDAGILSPATRNCSTTPVIGAAPSNSATQLAQATWSKVKTGFRSVFGVQTAYGVDLGLGGLTKRFSNIGPALAASIQPVGPTEVTLVGGGNFQAFVRIVGSNHHDNEHQNATGLGGLPVQFQVAAGNGTIAQLGDEIGGATQLSVITNTNPIDPESPTSGGGYAAVNWAVPNAPGAYQVGVTGPFVAGPITFTVTVVPPNVIGLAPQERRMLSMQTGASIQLDVTGTEGGPVWASSAPSNVQVTPGGLVTALVGGENIAGGNTAVLSSSFGVEQSGPTLLVDSFSFDIFPRTTTLAWVPVPGAASYQVVTEFGNGSNTNPFCTVPLECGVWTPGSPMTTSGLSTTIGFVGQQPGRWRVTALNAAGGVISTSPYIYFAYVI